MTASEQPLLKKLPSEGRWLVPPDAASGLHIQLDCLLEAEHLSPEVVALLEKLLVELQRSAQTVAAKGCPKLASCLDYTGDCSKLTDCGTYKVKIAST